MTTQVDDSVATLASTLSSALLRLSQDGSHQDLADALQDIAEAVDDARCALLGETDTLGYLGWSGPASEVPNSLSGWEED